MVVCFGDAAVMMWDAGLAGASGLRAWLRALECLGW